MAQNDIIKVKKGGVYMVSAISVGNTILQRAFVEDIDITPMKLQKLTYLVYKEYLKRTGSSLFSERFEVWKYGPVLRSIYDAFKYKRANAIKSFAKDSDGGIYVVNEEASTTFRQVLDCIWSKYKKYDGLVLSKMTHRNGTAWYNAAVSGETFLSDKDIMAEEDFA